MMVRPLADALVPEKKLGVGRLSARGEEEPEGAPAVLAKELQDKCLYVNTVRSWLVAVPGLAPSLPQLCSRPNDSAEGGGHAYAPACRIQPRWAGTAAIATVCSSGGVYNPCDRRPPPAGLVDVPAVLQAAHHPGGAPGRTACLAVPAHVAPAQRLPSACPPRCALHTPRPMMRLLGACPPRPASHMKPHLHLHLSSSNLAQDIFEVEKG